MREKALAFWFPDVWQGGANLFLFLTFAAVNLSLIVLRYKCKAQPRGFRCPANLGQFSLIAAAGLVSSLGMMALVVRNLL